MSKIDFASELRAVEDSVREHTEGYYHSSPVVSYGITTSGKTAEVVFDLRDFMIASAVTGMNVMLSGKTGGGKTSFSTAFVNSLFGGNYGFLQIDPSLNESKFRDMAFSVIKEGGMLSDAATPGPLITSPALVLDEYNRAPAALTDLLQGWLVNGFINLDGDRRVRPGVEMPNGSRYQLKIATINEGSAYVGTHAMDRAGRDRFAIEVPLDVFQPSDTDKRQIIERGLFSNGLRDGVPDLSDTIFRLNAALRDIPIAQSLIEFGVYMGKKDNCYKSPEGTKLTFDRFSAEICRGCVASPFGGMCGEVYAPSERAIGNTYQLARAFVLYRLYNHPDTPKEVTLNDFAAAAQFTLYKKMDMSPGWVEKQAAGSSWEATRVVIGNMQTNFLDSFKATHEILERQHGAPLSAEDKAELTDQLQKDPPFGTRANMIEINRNKGAAAASRPKLHG